MWSYAKQNGFEVPYFSKKNSNFSSVNCTFGQVGQNQCDILGWDMKFKTDASQHVPYLRYVTFASKVTSPSLRSEQNLVHGLKRQFHSKADLWQNLLFINSCPRKLLPGHLHTAMFCMSPSYLSPSSHHYLLPVPLIGRSTPPHPKNGVESLYKRFIDLYWLSVAGVHLWGGQRHRNLRLQEYPQQDRERGGTAQQLDSLTFFRLLFFVAFLNYHTHMQGWESGMISSGPDLSFKAWVRFKVTNKFAK